MSPRTLMSEKSILNLLSNVAILCRRQPIGFRFFGGSRSRNHDRWGLLDGRRGLTLCGRGRFGWSSLRWRPGSCSRPICSWWSAGRGSAESDLRKKTQELYFGHNISSTFIGYFLFGHFQNKELLAEFCNMQWKGFDRKHREPLRIVSWALLKRLVMILLIELPGGNHLVQKIFNVSMADAAADEATDRAGGRWFAEQEQQKQEE